MVCFQLPVGNFSTLLFHSFTKLALFHSRKTSGMRRCRWTFCFLNNNLQWLIIELNNLYYLSIFITREKKEFIESGCDKVDKMIQILLSFNLFSFLICLLVGRIVWSCSLKKKSSQTTTKYSADTAKPTEIPPRSWRYGRFPQLSWCT